MAMAVSPERRPLRGDSCQFSIVGKYNATKTFHSGKARQIAVALDFQRKLMGRVGCFCR